MRIRGSWPDTQESRDDGSRKEPPLQYRRTAMRNRIAMSFSASCRGCACAARQPPAHDGGNLFKVVHHRGELFRVDRLRAVGESNFRTMMHLDHHAVSAAGHGGAGHGQYAVAPAGAVAWVDKNREMADALERRNNAEVQRVARMVAERAHAALAQNNLVIALAHHVLGGHQQL